MASDEEYSASARGPPHTHLAWDELLDWLPPADTLTVYRDAETARLDALYDAAAYDGPVLSTMGTLENELTAALILTFSRRANAFVGIANDTLETAMRRVAFFSVGCEESPYGHLKGTVAYLLRCGYARATTQNDTLLLFPTECLLQNQELPRHPHLPPLAQHR